MRSIVAGRLVALVGLTSAVVGDKLGRNQGLGGTSIVIGFAKRDCLVAREAEKDDSSFW